MAEFAALAEKKEQLIRKALDGSLFCALFSADAITNLTDPLDNSLDALPTGYEDGGLMTDEGIRFDRTVTSDEVTSFGRTEPSRSDISSDVDTLQVDFQELKLKTLELYTGADMSGITPDATTGEIQIPKPARPAGRYYRLLALAVDETDDGEIYVARFYPRAKTTDYTEQAWAKGQNPIMFGMTFTAYVDTALGYSRNDLFGGPGWVALLNDMGWTWP